MLIKVKRSTGWIGSATKMQIIVNGERVAIINNNQILEVELPGVKNDLTSSVKFSHPLQVRYLNKRG